MPFVQKIGYLCDKQLIVKMMGIKQKEEMPNAGLHNTLAFGPTVKGNIATETDFRLDGRVEGDVVCGGKIVVGPKGCVVGNVTSANAEILGEVEGSVRISAKLVLKATAVIKGDIYTRTLEIEPNARFNGVCKMTEEELPDVSSLTKS